MVQSKATIAVIGASAYYAGPILRLLKSEGYSTVGLVRETSNADSEDPFIDRLARGVLSDFDFVAKATKDCSVLINLVNQLNPPKEDLASEIANDVGVLDACLYAASKNDALLIHTSGNFSLPTANRKGAIDDTLIPAPTDMAGFLDHWPTFEHAPEYKEALSQVMHVAENKHRLEHYIHMYLQVHPNTRACIIIPSATYGAGVKPINTFWDKVATAWAQGYVRDWVTNFIYIEDLARCYLAIIKNGKSGGRYLAAGEPMRVSDFSTVYCKAAGIAVQPNAQVTSTTIKDYYYDDSSARKQLDIEWNTTVKEGVPRLVQFLKEQGYLDKQTTAFK